MKVLLVHEGTKSALPRRDSVLADTSGYPVHTTKPLLKRDEVCALADSGPVMVRVVRGLRRLRGGPVAGGGVQSPLHTGRTSVSSRSQKIYDTGNGGNERPMTLPDFAERYSAR